MPGIGPQRRKALLRAFDKDIEAIREATIEELIDVPGITREIAENIKAVFRRIKVMDSAALEQEIIEAVRQLDEERQRQVLALARDLGQSQITLGEWLDRAHALREELRAKYGDNFYFNTVEVLDEIREERLNDIMSSLQTGEDRA